MKSKNKSNPFACLGTTIPNDQKPNNIINMDKDNEEYKSVPATPRNSIIVPSLASVSKSLISPSNSIDKMDKIDKMEGIDRMDRSFINRDYQFVFRSRPIDSCKYEPYKVILFIASGEGFNDNLKQDPCLSSKGISQCKIVSTALRKAKQASPNIMYCSTMYRALSTMQMICADWYDDIKSIGLDELRPLIGKYKTNKRSNIQLLKQDFKKVSFNHVKSDKDIYWKPDKIENEDNLSTRCHKFITKFLIPRQELLKTQYGTIVKPSKLENIGWNSSASSSALISTQRLQTNIDKRIVVISHRKWLSYFMKNIVIDISPELCKDWKYCDLRKVFVYTKQQLGINSIPCYALSDGTYYSPRFNQKKLNDNDNNMQRSKTPKHKKSNSMINSKYIKNKYNNNNNNAIRRSNAISTTSTGDILMTNKLLFESHQFTLTTMSAALCNNTKPMPIIPLQSSRSADYNSSNQNPEQSSSSSSSSSNEDDDDDDDDDEIRVLQPGDLLKEIESSDINIIPSKHPIQNIYSRSHESPQPQQISQAPQLTLSTSTHLPRSGKISIKPKQHRIIVTPPTKSTVTKFSNVKTNFDDK